MLNPALLDLMGRYREKLSSRDAGRDLGLANRHGKGV